MSKNYSDLLKSPKWQRKRLEILNRDNFTCTLCGDVETELHVHHSEYNGKPWEVHNDKLKTVCKECHEILHLLNGMFVIYKLIKIHSNKVAFYYAFSHDRIVFLNCFIGEQIEIRMVIESSTIELLSSNIIKQ